MYNILYIYKYLSLSFYIFQQFLFIEFILFCNSYIFFISCENDAINITVFFNILNI